MMAHFVYQNMGHELLKALVAACDPFIENGHTEQPDAIRQSAARRDRLLSQRYALIEPGQFKRIADSQFSQRFLIGELLDPHHHIAEMRGELRRQPPQRCPRNGLDFDRIRGRPENSCHGQTIAASGPVRQRLRWAALKARALAFQCMRSGGRVVEGARLESEYTSKAYRGFESLPLRQTPFLSRPEVSKSFPTLEAFEARQINRLVARTLSGLNKPGRHNDGGGYT